MEKRILFAGNSDQGVLYAGQVFIEAAVEAGWHAACIDSGRQGDVVYCIIALSRDPLRRGPAMPEVGMLVSLPAADAFERSIRPGGLLVLNGNAIRRPVLRRDVDVVMVPVDAEPEDPSLATLTLLGALAALTGWMPVDDAVAVVHKSCVGNAACQAFRQGVTFVEEMLKNTEAEAA
jgi:2-oxoglutarate ferredoxin oxidoreductase subunit gamma